MGLAIRRTTHLGQYIQQNKNEIINNFKRYIILKRKELYIEEDEDYRLINMDETGLFLEMGFNTTIDFRGHKNIDIETNGKEHYRITVILSAAGDGTKLTPLIIVKGEPGKTVETNLRKLTYVKNNNMFIYCQNNAWCSKFILLSGLKRFLNLMKKI